MGLWLDVVTDWAAGAELLRRRRYGVIEAVDGRFRRVILRPFPKLISAPEAALLGRFRHRRFRGDRCLLYYNQPWRLPNFLALKYVVSGQDGTLASFRRVLEALDQIARIKGTDALVCDAMNWRISDRLLARWGWESHCPSSWHRHFIKRFYGVYPGSRSEDLEAVGGRDPEPDCSVPLLSLLPPSPMPHSPPLIP